MAYDEVLAERIRDHLSIADGVTESGCSAGSLFLTYGNMTVGVHGDELKARIRPDDTETALAEPGVRLFDITGRPMKGWPLMAGEELGEDVLKRWLAQARAFVATLPPKESYRPSAGRR